MLKANLVDILLQIFADKTNKTFVGFMQVFVEVHFRRFKCILLSSSILP